MKLLVILILSAVSLFAEAKTYALNYNSKAIEVLKQFIPFPPQFQPQVQVFVTDDGQDKGAEFLVSITWTDESGFHAQTQTVPRLGGANVAVFYLDTQADIVATAVVYDRPKP